MAQPPSSLCHLCLEADSAAHPTQAECPVWGGPGQVAAGSSPGGANRMFILVDTHSRRGQRPHGVNPDTSQRGSLCCPSIHPA